MGAYCTIPSLNTEIFGDLTIILSLNTDVYRGLLDEHNRKSAENVAVGKSLFLRDNRL